MVVERRVIARAAVEPVVAAVALQTVLPGAGDQAVGGAVACERVGTAAGCQVFNDAAAGDAQVVGHAVAVAERPAVEVDAACSAPAAEIQRIGATGVINGQNGVRVLGKVVDGAETAGDIAVEAIDSVAATRAGVGPINTLNGLNVIQHGRLGRIR